MPDGLGFGSHSGTVVKINATFYIKTTLKQPNGCFEKFILSVAGESSDITQPTWISELTSISKLRFKIIVLMRIPVKVCNDGS